MQQGEGVCRGAGGGHPVAVSGSQVGGGTETSDPGGPSRCHGRLLVGAARPHLDDRASFGHERHAGRRRGDRGVVVVDGQQQGLQQARLGEGALDGEQW